MCYQFRSSPLLHARRPLPVLPHHRWRISRWHRISAESLNLAANWIQLTDRRSAKCRHKVNQIKSIQTEPYKKNQKWFSSAFFIWLRFPLTSHNMYTLPWTCFRFYKRNFDCNFQGDREIKKRHSTVSRRIAISILNVYIHRSHFNREVVNLLGCDFFNVKL